MSIDSGVTHRIIGTETEIVHESALKLRPDGVYEDLSGFDSSTSRAGSAPSR